MQKSDRRLGFTLAEVLITLVIIGVIAAISVPTIMANSRKTETETRLKQTYSILNNALKKSIAENGPINTWDPITSFDGYYVFFEKYINKQLNFAEKGTLSNLNYKEIYTPRNTVYMKFSDSNKNVKPIGILNNGTIIIGWTGGWCAQDNIGSNKELDCASIAYFADINGIKKPNTLGKDVFGFELFFVDKRENFEMLGSVELSMQSTGTLNYGDGVKLNKLPRKNLIQNCKMSGLYCGAIIQNNGWKIPKDYPINI